MPDVTRIIEQKPTESIYNDDWVLIDRPTEGEDGGTRKILASKLKELFCGDYMADEWVAGETYTNGAIVSHEGKLYYNSTGASLTQSTFDANAWLEVKIDELLEKLIGSVGEKWRSIDTYRYDDLVVYGGRLYRCIKNASTQGTWVSNEWIEANAEYYFKKMREYIARYGFIPSGEAVSSPYNKGDLILYRAPGDTTNSLYMRLNDTEHGDPTWIPENWLKVGNIGGALSKIYDDMEESSCDVQIKEQSIVDENNVADLTSLAAVGSASGAIATFDDGSDLPMPSLKVAIEPQQDLHGYDAPWVGGAGKNKFPIATASSSGAQNIFSSQAISLKANTNYILSFDTSNPLTKAMSVSFNAGSTQVRGIDIPAGTSTVGISFSQNVDNLDWYVREAVNISNIMIEEGGAKTDFAPYSNICPISGWDEVNVTRCGVNVWDEEWEVGYIDFQGNNTVSSVNIRSKNFIQIKPNTRYYLKSEYTTIVYCPIFFYDANKVLLSANLRQVWNRVITTPSNARYIRFYMNSAYGNVYNNDISINYPSTDTEYHAYNGQTYTIDLDGTRYGGTLDVVSGLLTVDRAYVDLGTLSWTYVSAQKVFYDSLPTNALNVTNKNGLCEGYKPTAQQSMDSGTWSRISNGEFVFAQNLKTSGRCAVAIKNLNYTDTTEFKSSVNGMKMLYPLATPQSIQLTPTQVKSLLWVNNVWADTGDVLDAEYIRDATTIINSLIARIEALENQ